jgi:hypothetical protein
MWFDGFGWFGSSSLFTASERFERDADSNDWCHPGEIDTFPPEMKNTYTIRNRNTKSIITIFALSLSCLATAQTPATPIISVLPWMTSGSLVGNSDQRAVRQIEVRAAIQKSTFKQTGSEFVPVEQELICSKSTKIDVFDVTVPGPTVGTIVDPAVSCQSKLKGVGAVTIRVGGTLVISNSELTGLTDKEVQAVKSFTVVQTFSANDNHRWNQSTGKSLSEVQKVLSRGLETRSVIVVLESDLIVSADKQSADQFVTHYEFID